MPNVRLDHISYAAGPEGLGAAAQRIGAALGAGFRDGGLHPRFGTRNFILPLSNGVYLEVVGALDHPAADKAPFGQAVKARSEAGGGWLAWVVAVDDITPVEQRLGRPAVTGHRRRPDGLDLTWKQIGVLDLLDDPALPFFIEWDVPPELHPSADGDVAIGIHGAEICGDRDAIARWLDEPLEKADFRIDWIQDEDPGLVAVEFSTPHGTVRID
ncbi:MAG: VOC family protein [Actinomycetes bacterium]